MTDSESLLKVIVKASKTTENKLKIDLRVTREAYEGREISDVGRTRSEGNVADGLTKRGRCKALENMLDIDKLDMNIEQWVVRKKKELARTMMILGGSLSAVLIGSGTVETKDDENPRLMDLMKEKDCPDTMGRR